MLRREIEMYKFYKSQTIWKKKLLLQTTYNLDFFLIVRVGLETIVNITKSMSNFLEDLNFDFHRILTIDWPFPFFLSRILD